MHKTYSGRALKSPINFITGIVIIIFAISGGYAEYVTGVNVPLKSLRGASGSSIGQQMVRLPLVDSLKANLVMLVLPLVFCYGVLRYMQAAGSWQRYGEWLKAEPQDPPGWGLFDVLVAIALFSGINSYGKIIFSNLLGNWLDPQYLQFISFFHAEGVLFLWIILFYDWKKEEVVFEPVYGEGWERNCVTGIEPDCSDKYTPITGEPGIMDYDEAGAGVRISHTLGLVPSEFARNIIPAVKAWLGFIPFFYVAMFGGFFIVNLLLYLNGQRFFTPESQDAIRIATDGGSSVIFRATFCVFAIIGAPVVEECLFRGLLYGALRKYLPWGLSAVLSGIVFGLIHGDMLRFVPLAVLGIYLAVLRERSRGLAMPIIVHALHNGSTLAMVFLF